MPRYLLRHSHDAADCEVAFAAWKGFASPLSGTTLLSSCPGGEHDVYAVVTALGPDEALGQLPPWVRSRATATLVRDVRVA